MMARLLDLRLPIDQRRKPTVLQGLERKNKNQVERASERSELRAQTQEKYFKELEHRLF